MTTLSEVARLAGVTSATVSNVLRQRGKVGEQTRLRVLAAVEELGYRPHLTARALAEGRAPTLALMVSSIANPFYPEFALAAERAARAHGRFLIVCNTNDDPETGRAYLEQIAGTLSDGVLIMNANLSIDELRKAQQRGAPVVLCMWEKPDAPPELPCIAVNFHEAGAIAGRHLIGLGHRRIGALVGSKKGGIHAERYQGYLDACADAGFRHPQNRTRFIADTVEAGYQATMSMLASSPQLTAIFASNDLPALGAMNAIADMGLNVPRDISVIGITDIQWARVSRPALTTVAVPTASAAEMAIDLLLALINRSSASSPMRVTATPQLVERASTAIAREA
ncbi:LacI family DNA-binding transcriptional regulator [Herbaspirillum sp. WKF16]|jgi:DNA-binding LacI/PurR family transcriptional regulator|uniref:LacI family DNA-binding transcriptional regulator n=1 Tax=Herbaspirillum sp. WKF16 TaxID=3028312 RepID=UPI0023A939C7|nr:LacI family DNA-binding transcriptional regulator [Herbaspirillum sp. WKF16]WDZ96691.1 LacI family DNA-binding transcriptional regulator [Herbaspirillum sp. WKF16]